MQEADGISMMDSGFKALCAAVLGWCCIGGTPVDAADAYTIPPPGETFVYLESTRIHAFFEATDLNGYRALLPGVFTMPERPLVQVSFADNYKMETGPTYLLSSISILVNYGGKPGWYILTMPETNEVPVRGGVRLWGYPKIVRKVTLDDKGGDVVGTSYLEDGVTPEFRLTLKIDGEPLSAEQRQLFDLVAPVPSLTIKSAKVLAFGGARYPVYDLERVAPQAWKIRFGNASVDYHKDPNNLLFRIGVGRFLAGYWANVKSRHVIAPNK
jgi:hypothetical protein